jgi:hypothetical protein
MRRSFGALMLAAALLGACVSQAATQAPSAVTATVTAAPTPTGAPTLTTAPTAAPLLTPEATAEPTLAPTHEPAPEPTAKATPRPTIFRLPTIAPLPADPTAAAKAAGATAICADGTWSYSAHRSGTCSHHGGVHWWTGNLGPAGPGGH